MCNFDIENLIKQKNWKELIKLSAKLSIEEKSRYLWVWPTENNLIFIKNILDNLNIHAILSIGCGTGLLEWIIQQSTGINVCGIEYDRCWWESKYSPKSYIKLNFLKDENNILTTEEFLKHSIHRNDWKFALLFCYFNNRSAFQEYINSYKGDCIIIIGPGEGRYTHTDPEPFNPKFNETVNGKWILKDFNEIDSTKDFIAVYTRN